MKGLFYKDITFIWKLIIAYAVVMIAQIEIVNELEPEVIEEVMLCTVILSGIATPLMLIADDYKSGFLKYTKVLPIRRGLVIAEKYIMAFVSQIMVLAIGLIYIIMRTQGDNKDIWKIIFLGFAFSLVVNGILLLLIIAFGTEKGIVVTFIVISILIVLGMIVTGIIDSLFGLDEFIYNSRGYVLGASILIYGLLYLATTRIYIRKEFE